MQKAFYASVLCALVLSGCASEEIIPVPYVARGASQIGSGISVTTVVIDARREDRDRISAKINARGQEMAAIRADREVTAIVKDAFNAELMSRGYAVAQGGVTTRISVTRFYTLFKPSLLAYFEPGFVSGDANADVQFSVTVSSADGAIQYRRNIAAIGSQINAQMLNGASAAAALSDGLAKAFATIFSDEKFTAALRRQGIRAGIQIESSISQS